MKGIYKIRLKLAFNVLIFLIIIAILGLSLIAYYKVNVVETIDISSILMIFVTSLYVWLTLIIVSQSQESILQADKSLEQADKSIKQADKHNKINYIQKQLEDFYNPFKMLFNTDVNGYYRYTDKNGGETIPAPEFIVKHTGSDAEIINGKNVKITLNNYQGAKSMYSNIFKHRYLRQTNSAEIFDIFFAFIQNEKKAPDYDIRSMAKYFKKLDKTIENDTNDLIKELSNLIDKK